MEHFWLCLLLFSKQSPERIREDGTMVYRQFGLGHYIIIIIITKTLAEIVVQNARPLDA